MDGNLGRREPSGPHDEIEAARQQVEALRRSLVGPPPATTAAPVVPPTATSVASPPAPERAEAGATGASAKILAGRVLRRLAGRARPRRPGP